MYISSSVFCSFFIFLVVVWSFLAVFAVVFVVLLFVCVGLTETNVNVYQGKRQLPFMVFLGLTVFPLVVAIQLLAFVSVSVTVSVAVSIAIAVSIAVEFGVGTVEQQ